MAKAEAGARAGAGARPRARARARARALWCDRCTQRLGIFRGLLSPAVFPKQEWFGEEGSVVEGRGINESEGQDPCQGGE